MHCFAQLVCGFGRFRGCVRSVSAAFAEVAEFLFQLGDFLVEPSDLATKEQREVLFRSWHNQSSNCDLILIVRGLIVHISEV